MHSNPLDIIGQILDLDEPVALIAVTEINGGTLRAKGALMAVTASDVYGYISAGCVDGDIAFQAREALNIGEVRSLIYGEGSPFKDIALPCGGTIKVSIFPNPDRAVLTEVMEKTQSRRSATLQLPEFTHVYSPKLCLRIVGRGAPFQALTKLALTAGFIVHGQSPDAELNQSGFYRFDHLKDPSDTPASFTDPWTAVVFLFHDHDWEPVLLRQALAGEHFYIGAMGSDRTHKLRLETLNEMGVTGTDRIRGPIGLIPALRDANRLAVSVLAEIIATAQDAGRLS